MFDTVHNKTTQKAVTKSLAKAVGGAGTESVLINFFQLLVRNIEIKVWQADVKMTEINQTWKTQSSRVYN